VIEVIEIAPFHVLRRARYNGANLACVIPTHSAEEAHFMMPLGAIAIRAATVRHHSIEAALMHMPPRNSVSVSHKSLRLSAWVAV
jgi:hypothetical protein